MLAVCSWLGTGSLLAVQCGGVQRDHAVMTGCSLAVDRPSGHAATSHYGSYGKLSAGVKQLPCGFVRQVSTCCRPYFDRLSALLRNAIEYAGVKLGGMGGHRLTDQEGTVTTTTVELQVTQTIGVGYDSDNLASALKAARTLAKGTGHSIAVWHNPCSLPASWALTEVSMTGQVVDGSVVEHGRTWYADGRHCLPVIIVDADGSIRLDIQTAPVRYM